MRIAIAGATGFVGAPLVSHLGGRGHEVLRLVRSDKEAAGDSIRWDPAAAVLDATALQGIDACINLSGENLGSRWSASKKREFRSSRMSTTGLLARTLAALAGKPALFVSASAVGIYGADRGDLFLDEKSSLGSDFLAQLCQDWEAATEPARAAGIRVIHSRTGIVLHPDGSVLAKLMPVFRMGVGGKAGSGDQWTSWIARTDLIRAITFLVESSDAPEGPFNLVAPTPVTNAELSKTLGHVLRRPAVAPVPAAVLRLALGREMADLTVLASQKVHPTRLLEAGFEFQLPELEAALRREIGA